MTAPPSPRPGEARWNLPPEIRWLLEIVLALVVVTAAVLLGTRHVAIPWAVTGRSMEPTLAEADRVIVDLWSYRRRPPKPGEVTLFLGPQNTPLVKRIVVDEGPAFHAAPWTLDPEDRASPRLWVRGDNPEESADSRFFGPVPLGRFRGRVVFRYWPLSKLGPIR
jgi:signal peptidase I